MDTSFDPLQAAPFSGLSGVVLDFANKVPAVDGRPFSQVWREYFTAPSEHLASHPVASTPQSVLNIYPPQFRGASFFAADDELDDGSSTDFTKEDYAHSDFTPEAGVVYAAFIALLGGFNGKCYCSEDQLGHDRNCVGLELESLRSQTGYVTDFEDMTDQNFKIFVYRTELTFEDVVEFKLEAARIKQAEVAMSHFRNIQIGLMSPWSILSADAFDLRAQALERAELALKFESRIDFEELEFLEGLFGYISSSRQDQAPELPSSIGSIGPEGFQKGPRGDRFRDAELDSLLSLDSWNRELKALNEAEADLLTLPEGSAARNYFLKDRGKALFPQQTPLQALNLT